MPLPPTIIPVKPRVRRKRRAGGTATPAPPAALTLVSVSGIDSGPDYFVGDLTFNTTSAQPIGDVSAADPGKWLVRYGGVRYVGTTLANESYNLVNLSMDPVGPEAGPDVIIYTNAPSDISDTLGRQLAAISGMPI